MLPISKFLQQQNSYPEWIKTNQNILDQMFKGTLVTEESSKGDRKIAKEYFKEINQWCLEVNQRRRYLLAHSTIQNVIGQYFGLLGWDYGFEIPFADLDSNYRFDLLAQKGQKIIVVEVKPEVTTKELGQVIGYVHDIQKKFKKARVFLGTDILSLYLCFGTGEVAGIIREYASNHGLGIILADTQAVCCIPAEILLL